MKEHEGRMILKFNTCLILMKNIESVVKHAIDIWRDVFHLNKTTNETIEIKDDDSDDEDDNIPLVPVTEGEMQELMEEKEEEEKEEEAKEEDKDEEDPVIIAAEVIAYVPHSPPKTVTSSMETTSASETVSSSATSIAQSSPATSQL